MSETPGGASPACERDDLVHNLTVLLGQCDKHIQEKMVRHFGQCDEEFGRSFLRILP